MAERALIIGASGGIGAALCAALEARGAEVTGLSRSGDGLDVTDAASLDRVLGAVEGPFDRIVVATGILAPEGGAPEKSLDAIDAAAMARVFAVDALGPALVLRHAPRLLPREGRSVLGVLTARVGSIGDNRMGGWYSYRAAKAAANQITHSAAIEIGRRYKEAVVVALHPGTVATPFTASYTGHDKVSPEQAAENLIAVMDGLTHADTGGFFDWAGKPVPW
ncbi:SDR family NAD(P)-dependent oxidoreductase [Rhodobacterales bacterium HKCCE2091]|nr:SDR family NAD(P)-dependent oxidoreductase [Rhodobacterales bacterium HKCCE2091]